MNIRTSIIMPVKNGELYIEDSLKSVLKNISDNDEMIIINDGSTDKTVEIIKTFTKLFNNISLFHGNNLLPSGARNLGLKKSKGGYISFIDHDDRWPDGRLNHHLNLLEESKNFDVIQGMVKYFSADPVKLEKFTFLNESNLMFFFQLGSFTFKRKVFEAVGSFNPQLKFGEDVDLYSRMIDKKVNIFKDQNISLLYRIHDTNMTHNLEENNGHVLLKVLSNSIKRKRNIAHD